MSGLEEVEPVEYGPLEERLAQPGGITYLQIPAVDAQRSGGFYERVFGWNAHWPGTEEHLSFDDAATHMAGAWVAGRAIASEPGVLPYVYVDSIDGTLQKVLDYGGQVVAEPYREGDLWVATFRDPAGNVIGIWRQGSR